MDSPVRPAAAAPGPDAAPETAGFPGLITLAKRSDFLRAARARRQSAPGFLLQARRRDAAETGATPGDLRIGYTCSKKIGNAVTRNRAKRRLRALAREVLPVSGHPGWDYVLVGRPAVTTHRTFALMLDELHQALARIHAPKNGTNPPSKPGPRT